MRFNLILSGILLIFFSTQAQNKIAITHVSVVNVNNSKIENDQTVLLDSNMIVAVGSFKKIKIPQDATIIDGKGKYLMPGLTDAHIHFFQSGSLYTRPDGFNFSAVYPYEKDQKWIKDNFSQLMKRYLAAGITTVADVGGPMSNFERRSMLEKDATLPYAWVTGPLISTYQPPNLDKKDPPILKVNTAEEARELVRKQIPSKPDFIKIWFIVLPNQEAKKLLPIVQAAIDESHKNGLKVAVHATEHETAKLAVENGADILVHSVDDKVLSPEFLRLLKEKQTVYIPTLLVAQNYNRAFTQQFNYSPYELKIADPIILGTLMDIQHMDKSKVPFDYKKMRARTPIPSHEDSTMLQNLSLLSQFKGLIVSGTDAGNIGTHHGSSLYPEFLAMKQAGLSNQDIIKSSTINAAKGFGRSNETGSIEKGKRADLLLLKADPFADLSALQQIELIFHKGKRFTPTELLSTTPESLVQQQLNAYNLHDTEAFLEPYADDVELYEFPNKLVVKGKEAMRNDYKGMFQSVKDLHCEVTKRIIQGNTVIDHESVSGFGPKPMSAIAIYKIEKGKIAKVYFIQ